MVSLGDFSEKKFIAQLWDVVRFELKLDNDVMSHQTLRAGSRG